MHTKWVPLHACVCVSVAFYHVALYSIDTCLSFFSPPPLLYSVLFDFFLKNDIHFHTQEPQPLADLQCEDPRSGVLHGGSVPWSHAYLDGCYCNRCWRTHALHGLTELQLLFARLPKKNLSFSLHLKLSTNELEHNFCSNTDFVM